MYSIIRWKKKQRIAYSDRGRATNPNKDVISKVYIVRGTDAYNSIEY